MAAMGGSQAGLVPAVAEAGGSMVVLSHPGRDGWDRQAVWGPPGPAARVMQAVKDQLDPKGILNAGRYVFASR